MTLKCIAIGQYGSPQNLAACIATWANDELDRYVIADAAGYLVLPLTSDDGAPCSPYVPPGVAYDLLDVRTGRQGGLGFVTHPAVWHHQWSFFHKGLLVHSK